MYMNPYHWSDRSSLEFEHALLSITRRGPAILAIAQIIALERRRAQHVQVRTKETGVEGVQNVFLPEIYPS